MFLFVSNCCFGPIKVFRNKLKLFMTAKMPYLKEDEIVVNGKTTVNSISSTSDVDDAEESFFENKVKFHCFIPQFISIFI